MEIIMRGPHGEEKRNVYRSIIDFFDKVEKRRTAR
jgi:hypothetical protein